MKLMVKSTFVKSNVKLAATILIVLLLLLKVVKRNHCVHLLLPTAQSWMKIIQHSFSIKNLEALMRISMEGKDKLSDSDLDTLVDKFKNKKDRY